MHFLKVSAGRLAIGGLSDTGPCSSPGVPLSRRHTVGNSCVLFFKKSGVEISPYRKGNFIFLQMTSFHWKFIAGL